MNAIVVTIPLRLQNPLNGGQGRHWVYRSRTRRSQRGTTLLVVAAHLAGQPLTLPVVVTVTRIAPSRGLDPHDGLPASAKAVIDGVADALGVDDRDPRVTWRIDQRRGPWGVEIKLEART
jgi:hypothetical protein